MRKLAGFVLLACLLLPSALDSQEFKKGFSNDRSSGEGKMWLQWDESQRRGFVWGYIWGLERGYQNGCIALADATPSPGKMKLQEFDVSKTPLHLCISKELVFSKEIAFYATQITKFYETYPKDQDLPIRQIFAKFADSSNMTLEQIHSWYHTPGV